MKIEKLAEITAMLAKCHPEADVKVCYTVKHGKGWKTKRVNITGHRVGIMTHPAIKPTITFEIDHARSESVEETNAE